MRKECIMENQTTEYQYYHFCPRCGRELFLTELPGHNKKELQCRNCKFIFWQNSKPTASALIVDLSNGQPDKLLLAKRAIEPHKGMWDIPGGFLELGEHPEDGLKREILEELGVDIEIRRFIGIIMDRYGDKENAWTLNIFYETVIKSGVIKPADDVSKCEWFIINKLPGKMAFRNNEEGIDLWLELNGHQKRYHK